MVGISFLGKKVLFAQQIDRDKEKVIEIVGQIDLPSFPDLAYIHRSNFRMDMIELFGKIKNVLRFPDRQAASISVPSDWAHMYFTTVEANLTPEEKRAFLHWDFVQRFAETNHNFQPKFYSVGISGEYEKILNIALPVELLDILLHVTKQVHFSLELVDIDMLTALLSIPRLEKKQFICKFTPFTIQVAEAYDKDFKAMVMFSKSSDTEELDYIRGTVGVKYADILRNKLCELLDARKSSDDNFWVYGTEIPHQVQSLLQSTETVNIVHPFYGFEIQSGAANNMSILEASEYTEVTGVIRHGIEPLA